MTRTHAHELAANIQRWWSEYVARFSELHSLFADLRLNVTAKRAAAFLGLADSRALEHWLRKRRLPPFRILRDWYYLVLMLERDGGGDAIAHWTLHDGTNPSVYYNFARKVSQSTWTSVKSAGILSAKEKAMQIWTAHTKSL